MKATTIFLYPMTATYITTTTFL